jgi:chromosome segregation ATPase
MNRVVADIKHHVSTLLDERSMLQNKIEELNAQVEELRVSLINKDREIEALEESNKTLKIAKSLTGTEEHSDAKQKINELVREIDKCIALLHK